MNKESDSLTSQSEQYEDTDTLPDDLDVTKYVGPYQFPTPRKRRIAAYGILVIAALTFFIGINSKNNVLIIVSLFCFALGSLFFATAWPLNVNDIQALTDAAKQSPFSVGHASAQLSFSGWFSKPTWRVVVFSSDEPPSERGLVEINAVNSKILSTYFDKEESNPNA